MPRAQTVGQALAQEKTARQHANKIGAALTKNLAKQTLFAGLIKTYRPFGDPEQDPTVIQIPTQSTHVQFRVEPDLFDALREALAPALNLTAAKEWGNQQARAGIEIGGELLFEGVPATYLLFLEHQVDELKPLIDLIPTLDSAEKWTRDTTEGVWRTEEPDKTLRDDKQEIPLVLHPGNEHHAPQVKSVVKPVYTGEYSTTKFSGAIEPRRKEEIQKRLHELKQAIHRARERANQAEAPAQDIGTKLLDYLFA